MTELAKNYVISSMQLEQLVFLQRESERMKILERVRDIPYPEPIDVVVINLENGARVLLKNKTPIEIVELLQEGYTLEAQT